MDERSNNLLSWIDYLCTSTVVDEILEAYLLDDIEEHAKQIKKENSDGHHCAFCNDYAKYAEPNQVNGTFICYSCRTI